MSSMFFLTVIIVLVSGLIAYIGDLIGRKMGRKRLTLFGLRPRYTAIVISVGIGMLIAALTLTTTFVVNKRVRDAFFTPIEHLRTGLIQLQRELDASQQLTAMAKHELAQRTEELQHTDAKSRQITAQMLLVQASVTRAQLRARQKQHELDTLSQRLAGVKQQLAEAQRNLAQAKSTADTIILRKNQSLLQLQNEQLALQANITRLRAEKTTYETVIGEFAKTNFAPLIFEQGQEILTGLFPTHGSERDLHTLLEQFVATATSIIRRRSPKMTATDSVLLFYRTPAHENELLTSLTAEEAINLLGKRIRATTSPDSVLVQLVPANNVRINGPAMIVIDTLAVLPNNIVYEKGAEVAHIQLPEHASQAVILGKLDDDLLHNGVPIALREKQMPMIIQRFAPDATGMVMTTPSKISWADLLAATDAARQLRGTVIVTARARTRLHYFDPLDLTLDVTQAKL